MTKHKLFCFKKANVIELFVVRVHDYIIVRLIFYFIYSFFAIFFQLFFLIYFLFFFLSLSLYLSKIYTHLIFTTIFFPFYFICCCGYYFDCRLVTFNVQLRYETKISIFYTNILIKPIS